MNAKLERIIEHFKGEIEEAIETTLEEERKYSEQLEEQLGAIPSEHGVMQWYSTGYSGNEGTIFDIADKIVDYLQSEDGDPLPYSDISDEWNKEDLNEVYSWLTSCISDLEYVKVDKTVIHRAKDLIVYSFILDHLPAVADKFKEDNENWYLQLDDDEYYENDLVPMFIEQLLGDLEQGLSDDETADYALFIKEEMLAYLK